MSSVHSDAWSGTPAAGLVRQDGEQVQLHLRELDQGEDPVCEARLEFGGGGSGPRTMVLVQAPRSLQQRIAARLGA